MVSPHRAHKVVFLLGLLGLMLNLKCTVFLKCFVTKPWSHHEDKVSKVTVALLIFQVAYLEE